MKVVVRELEPNIVPALASEIVVERRAVQNPEARYNIETSDTAEIWLTIQANTPFQLSYQFSHEFGHVLCNHNDRYRLYETHHPASLYHWLEEALCDAVKHYCLNMMAASGELSESDPEVHDRMNYYASQSRGDDLPRATAPVGERLSDWFVANRRQIEASKAANEWIKPLGVWVGDKLLANPLLLNDIRKLNTWAVNESSDLAGHLDRWEQACDSSDGLPHLLREGLLAAS